LPLAAGLNGPDLPVSIRPRVFRYPFAAHFSCFEQELDRLPCLRGIRVWSDDDLFHIERVVHICKCELAIWNHCVLAGSEAHLGSGASNGPRTSLHSCSSSKLGFLRAGAIRMNGSTKRAQSPIVWVVSLLCPGVGGDCLTASSAARQPSEMSSSLIALCFTGSYSHFRRW